MIVTNRLIGWVLTAGGAAGALAAFVLAVEKAELLANPAYVPSCSINPVLSCGSVMATGQAEVFGFPNPFLGVAAFPMVLVIGLAILAGWWPPRWWWAGLQAGTLLGAVFVTWLFHQSLYRIGALCPYCMVVWVVMVLIFCYTTLVNLERGRLGVRAPAVARLHSVYPVMWLLVLAVLIGVRFWDYWRTLV